MEFSPDGCKIAYRWLRKGDYTDTPLMLIEADGANRVNLSAWRAAKAAFRPGGPRPNGTPKSL